MCTPGAHSASASTPAIAISEAIAEYRGQRIPIVFSGTEWVALRGHPGSIPDGFESGTSPVGQGHSEPWVKVPRTCLDDIVLVRVTGTIRGHEVAVSQRMPDGRVRVTFIGPPAVARELGLNGDQYMGWDGLFHPEDFEKIEVEETRRA